MLNFRYAMLNCFRRQTERRNAMDRQLQQQKRCSSLSVHHLEQIYSKSPNQQDPSSGAIYVQQTLKSDHPADRSLTPEDESHIKHVCGQQQQQQLKQQHHLLLHHHQQQQSLSAESKIYQTERIWESPLTRLTQPIGATGRRKSVQRDRKSVQRIYRSCIHCGRVAGSRHPVWNVDRK